MRKTIATVLALTVAAVAAAELERIPGPRLAGRPQAGEPYRGEYTFTTDWFTARIPVWAEALAPYRGRPNLRYLEIGVFEGRSLVWMLEQVLTDPTSTAVAIDPFLQKRGEEIERLLRHNVEQAGAGERVTLIKGYSQLELRRLEPESFDIIYIDGSHEAADVLEDAVLSFGLLRPGGMLIFDDYLWRARAPLESRPEKAIYEFWWFFRDRLEVVHSAYQVFLKKLPARTD